MSTTPRVPRAPKLLAARFELARVTIEMTAPFIVGGRDGTLVDAAWLADANGLPAIPGASLAGVLRHAVARALDPQHPNPDTSPVCEALFGFQKGRAGKPSRVHMSWAQPHDAKGCPVPFRHPEPTQLAKDDVLCFLREGVVRDHVRIDERGVVDKTGKFDTLLVPKGARFTFELRLDLDDGVGGLDRWTGVVPLVQTLARQALGGHTRRGFGSFEVRRCRWRAFDLADKRDWDALCALEPDLSRPLGAPGFEDWRPVADETDQSRGGHERDVALSLDLRVDSFLRFGTGDLSQFVGEEEPLARVGNRPIDLLPVRESCIEWVGESGSVTRRGDYVLAGSGIKGAIRHRTAFHARRLRGEFLDGSAPLPRLEDDEAIRALFGSAKEKEDGEPGRVRVGDVRLAPKHVTLQRFDHVSLDRFTQGPMSGALFQELVVAPDLPLRVQIDVQAGLVRDAVARQAFALAIRDLGLGRLPIGAASSRGHGVVRFTDEGERAWHESPLYRWLPEVRQ